MDYEVRTENAEYTYKDLGRAYDRFFIEDTAILVRHGYIDGEYFEETIDAK